MPADDGPTLTYEDETYHFCSQPCKRAFERNPKEHLERIIRGSDDEHSGYSAEHK